MHILNAIPPSCIRCTSWDFFIALHPSDRSHSSIDWLIDKRIHPYIHTLPSYYYLLTEPFCSCSAHSARPVLQLPFRTLGGDRSIIYIHIYICIYPQPQHHLHQDWTTVTRRRRRRRSQPPTRPRPRTRTRTRTRARNTITIHQDQNRDRN